MNIVTKVLIVWIACWILCVIDYFRQHRLAKYKRYSGTFLVDLIGMFFLAPFILMLILFCIFGEFLEKHYEHNKDGE